MRKSLLIRMLSLLIAGILLCLCMAGCKEAEKPSGGENTGNQLGDEIILSAFWPPMEGFMTDEQFINLQEACIDLLEWGPDPIFSGEQTIKDMLRLTEKYGIKVTIADKDYVNWTKKSEKEIIELVNRYKDYPSVVGYFIVDEPYNANPLGRIFRTMLEVDPGCIPQMNLLPPIAAVEDPRGYAEDWISSVGTEMDAYLSFDQYPLGIVKGSYPGHMFRNIELIWSTGLKYDVKTAIYIQSTGADSEIASYRRPTVEETRFLTSSALAYGYKNLKYFTWMSAVNRSEPFLDGVIKPNGERSDTYAGIAENNRKIKAVSNILGRLDAIEVYHGGPQRDADTRNIPKEWYVDSAGKENFIVSVMVDKYNGKNYLMFVNKNFNKDLDITFELNGLTALTDVTDGRDNAKNVEITDNRFTGSFEAGGFRLYEVPDGLSLVKVKENKAGSNLAKNCAVYSSFSSGEDSRYNYKAVDGKRTSKKNSYGWHMEAAKGEPGWFMVDLGAVKEINRVDLYPAGFENGYGNYFPNTYLISVSEDGKNFTEVARETDDTFDAARVPSYTFDKTAVRYVKITIENAPLIGDNMVAEFAEVEIYMDDGSVAKAEPYI